MKSIINLYVTDLKRITSNWAAAIVITGLIALPSLYAWFNILASWDPYSNTKGISIAVANNDTGDTLLDKPINIGKQIIESLKTNEAIGWTFMDEKEALRRAERGQVYAAIIIPADFSARIGTVLTDNPQKAEIVYYVNEKINAISPKITGKGASGVIQQVSSNFVREANRTIFKIFNEVGVELKNELPTIEKVKNLVFKLEKGFPELIHVVDVALRDTAKANDIVASAQRNLPLVSQVAEEGARFSRSVGDLLNYSEQGIDTISPFIKQDLNSIHQTALAIQDLTSILQDAGSDPSIVKEALNRAEGRLDTAVTLVNGLNNWFNRLNGLVPGDRFGSTIDRLQSIRDKLERQLAIVRQISGAVERGEQVSADLINQLNRISKETADATGSLLNRYDDEIKPNIVQGIQTAKRTVGNAQTVLQDALKHMPDVKTILNDAAKLITVGSEEIKKIQQSLPEAQSKLTNIADRIRELEARGDINEIIDLLRNNFEKESEFFAEPVVLKEHKLFPIPNYGSAMSPFFTTLSLWVGALLLVSLLTVEVHEEGAAYKDYQVYFGRYLTFVTIALLQSLLVTLGDCYLLKAYVLNPFWFVIFGMLLSGVFMLIVYTLVSVFGNVGKALAIVLLVLQLAGSGGTFPIQVTPPFFQAIHPYLPFTYGISMMREAVGGILWDVVQRDLLMMCVYIAITLVIGLLLKTPLNRSSAKFVRKAKESKLIH